MFTKNLSRSILISCRICSFRLQNIIRLLGRLDQRLTEMGTVGKPLTSTVDGQQALPREAPV